MTDTSGTLADQQAAFFDRFGYLSFPGLLSDRIERIIEEFEAVWSGHGGGHHGKPHEGAARSCLVPFIDQSEYLSSLLDDPRILGIAARLLREDFNYMGSDGNYYVGDTPWHSDGWHTDLLHVKIAFYLDPLTRDTGALRVIPGSHLPGDRFADRLQSDISQCQQNWGLNGDAIPAVAFETEPGDVVCFNHNTKHAAFGGSQTRRMFTINLSQKYPDDRLDDLRTYIGGFARFWVDRCYGEAMMCTATPERQRHLRQIMENDGHLAELTRKAREAMPEPSRG
ncbi:MAG: phytanoyl-CoA dioxygenase family protein [Armatimonadetes bacterium]|nr:phytanoyl-CoA dioxygenase family protein [Armatimonadota bacterium]